MSVSIHVDLAVDLSAESAFLSLLHSALDTHEHDEHPPQSQPKLLLRRLQE